MILAYIFKPNSVFLMPITFKGIEVPYYGVAFVSILLIVTLQLLFLCQRSFLRKVQNIRSKTTLFLVNKSFDTYYILITTLYLVILAWSISIYTI